MTTPTSGQNEPSKLKKLTATSVDESIRTRLPHQSDQSTTVEREEIVTSTTVATSAPPEPVARERRWKFLPAFWTIASILSLTVNLILIIILLLAYQMLDQISRLQSYGVGQASGLLGGLYTNFVKMDQANIRTTIHIEEEIPVQFSLNVSGPTNVTLSQPLTIRGASVSVRTGGLNITDANATIVLPAGVVLPINIENLVVPVDQKVPAILDVPVDIPLNQTELHEPFVGLQQVVKPWYCLIQPDASVNGAQVCTPAPVIDQTLIDPALRTPMPDETLIP